MRWRFYSTRREASELFVQETRPAVRMAGPKPKYSYVAGRLDLTCSRSSEPTRPSMVPGWWHRPCHPRAGAPLRRSPADPPIRQRPSRRPGRSFLFKRRDNSPKLSTLWYSFAPINTPLRWRTPAGMGRRPEPIARGYGTIYCIETRQSPGNALA